MKKQIKIYSAIVFMLPIMIFLFGCSGQTKKELPESYGIPAYEKITIKTDGLKIELAEPVIVDVAKKPEEWGFFQFPALYRNSDGAIVARWNMAEDAIRSYGKDGHAYKISTDEGKTWHDSDNPLSVRDPGTLLPNGDRISVYTPQARVVKEISLPAPVDSADESYGRVFIYYRLNELPDFLQGVYLNRLPKGGTEQQREHAVINDVNAVRYSETGMIPIVWWGDMHVAPDSSVITGIYPAAYENKTRGKVDPSGVSFYRSTDNGHTWDILGHIPYTPDLKKDSCGLRRLALGFTEPAFEILPDGTFLCVMRTADGYDNSPMYATYSRDMGVSWSHPEPFTLFGVFPRLLNLENGVVALTSGRPGVQLRFLTDGKNGHWTKALEMLPFNNETTSCGYTGLLALGENRFLIIYSDFLYQTKTGESRKAIKVREVTVTPE